MGLLSPCSLPHEEESGEGRSSPAGAPTVVGWVGVVRGVRSEKDDQAGAGEELRCALSGLMHGREWRCLDSLEHARAQRLPLPSMKPEGADLRTGLGDRAASRPSSICGRELRRSFRWGWAAAPDQRQARSDACHDTQQCI
jgi:hypothetical protein